jgi:hypothetical protein
MGRGGIDVRIDGYGPNPALATRSDDPDRYLTPIGDEDFVEHRQSLLSQMVVL